MAGPNRSSAELVDLLARLAEAPHQFDFFQALRRLECAAGDQPRLGESARVKDDPIRLGQTPSLTFAPRTIDALAQQRPGGPPCLKVLFFGLFGPNGPLPLHLTEYARSRVLHHGDRTLESFADIFHHRLLSLFYRAWANSQPTVNLDRPETDRFASYVGSLIGLGSPAMRRRDTVPDQAKLYLAGQLASGPRHPEGLQAILHELFGLPVAIDEFVGRWTEIPADYRCLLDLSSRATALGVTTTIGSRVWDCQQTFRVVVGPLDLTDYLRLLPGGRSLPLLVDAVRNYMGDELMWELRLVLLRPQVPPTRLGHCGHLGLTAWLEPESLTRDADDFHWNPQLDGNMLTDRGLSADLTSLHDL